VVDERACPEVQCLYREKGIIDSREADSSMIVEVGNLCMQHQHAQKCADQKAALVSKARVCSCYSGSTCAYPQ
jgi:hypothetical protein